MNDLSGNMSSLKKSLEDAADGFKKAFIGLLIFSLIVTIGFIVIAAKK